MRIFTIKFWREDYFGNEVDDITQQITIPKDTEKVFTDENTVESYIESVTEKFHKQLMEKFNFPYYTFWEIDAQEELEQAIEDENYERASELKLLINQD